jgi:CrcB protein
VLNVIAVACGGAVGALARYWMSTLVYRQLGTGFPWGTLSVNVLGSLLMGILFVLAHQRQLPDPWRLALAVGLLGAFTTFSTFSVDTLALVEQGAWLRATLNVLTSVVLCLAAAFAGAALARAL